MAFDPETLLIVGAGFSANAGLPVANSFTQDLLNLNGLKLDGPSARQVDFIQKFVNQVFGEGASSSADEWPELEDVFTLVDLSANTGHHLGTKYSAAELRVVRRAIIVRMIRMLSQAYKRGQKQNGAGWTALERLFTKFNTAATAVLSMNWDTVFERGIARTQSIKRIDYGCHATALTFLRGQLATRSLRGNWLHILKPHGSVNWLYCDACRETFWLSPSHTEHVAQALFRREDWSVVLRGSKIKSPRSIAPACPHCEAKSLGTRFATFSYRKALDFPMHSASWRTAEDYLKASRNWVFIGYSMPPADFEFKHLLKRVQLTEKVRPEITVISGGSKAASDATIARYKKFFGAVSGERFFFKNGLDAAAMTHLRSVGVLTG
jgi:NAD-dependent SIR2 family protein deacetylase